MRSIGYVHTPAILRAIAEGNATAYAISKATGVYPSQVDWTLKGLERDGLIERDAAVVQSRTIRLTEAGKKAMEVAGNDGTRHDQGST